MTIRVVLLSLISMSVHFLSAQTIPRLTGPLAVYHASKGYCYSDSSGTDSIPIQEQFRFGELAIQNGRNDGGFRFIGELDSSVTWHTNRLMGVLNPPSEHGIYNVARDTSLLFSVTTRGSGTGMIQGGQRFSRLSKLYGPVCGVIYDDWDGNIEVTHDIYDAVRGKYVDAEGNVQHESVATTPDNKLYIVLYNTGAQPEAMPYMSGLYYSFFQYQNCCYTNIDENIDQLRANFPKKEIFIAIFLKNSALGWTDPESVHYMLAHALDRYDDGDINQVNLFAGSQLPIESMSLGRWDSLALPHWLDSLYYPYLGQGQGTVYDCTTGAALSDAFVRVYHTARSTGDTLFRSRQMTDATGSYQCGLWAGNRNTDSSYYWLLAEKEGYASDTVGFWIRRGDTTTIPSLSLCPIADASRTDYLKIFPNPVRSGFNVMAPDGEIGSQIEVYNMLGEKVHTLTQKEVYSYIDMTGSSDGMYVVAVLSGGREIDRKRILVLH